MLFGILKNSNKPSRVLVVDISSGTVGGAVIDYGGNAQPFIESIYRDITPFNKNSDENSVYPNMLSSLTNVCLKLLPNLNKIDQIHVVLSSPFAIWSSHRIQFVDELPFTVNQDRVDRLVSEHLSKEKIGEYLPGKSGIPIEKRITGLKLNGYAISSPFGKKATRLEIPYFVSFSTKEIISEIENTLKKHLHSKKIYFHSLAFLAYNGIREAFEKPVSFISIIMHGEVTDVIAGNDNFITGTYSFPIGSRTIFREYALNDKSGSRHGAVSELSMFAAGEFEKSVLNDTKIGNLCSEWTNEIIKFIEILRDEAFFSQKIYVASDFSIEKYLSNVLTIKLNDTNVQNQNLKTVTPLSEIISQSLRTKGIKGSGDFLMDFLSANVIRFM